MIDLHCHILPGIDDGPADILASIAMAEKLGGLGFKIVCATPHLPWNRKVFNCQELKERVDYLSNRISAQGNHLELIASAEHFCTDVPDLLNRNGLCGYPDTNHFLMEFAPAGFPGRLQDLLFLCQIKGRTPVIAHVERYPEVQKDPKCVEQLRQRGCRLLVNLSSLAGAWNREAQRAAKRLLKNGLVDAVSTDLHSVQEIEAVSDGITYLRELLDEDSVRSLLEEMPRKILGLDEISTIPPVAS